MKNIHNKKSGTSLILILLLIILLLSILIIKRRKIQEYFSDNSVLLPMKIVRPTRSGEPAPDKIIFGGDSVENLNDNNMVELVTSIPNSPNHNIENIDNRIKTISDECNIIAAMETNTENNNDTKYNDIINKCNMFLNKKN